MSELGILEQAQEENTLLRSQLDSVQKERDSLALELKYTRQELELLKRKIFGIKSEKISDSQLLLALEILEEAKKEEEAEASQTEEVQLKESTTQERKRKPIRTPIPDHLEEEVKVIYPEEVKGKEDQYEIIREERSERIDLIPAKLIKRVTIRPVCVAKEQDAKPVCAPMPAHVIDKGIADVGLLVFILISKYVDHLPLYRLEQIFKCRYDLQISRKTMWIGFG